MTRRILPRATKMAVQDYVLALGEIVFDQTDVDVLIGDGITPGGKPLLGGALAAAASAASDADQTANDRIQTGRDATAAEQAAATLNLHTTVADGLAATTNGQYFSVPATGEVFVSLYENTSGTATLINTYPSYAALLAGVANVQAAETQALADITVANPVVRPRKNGPGPRTGTAITGTFVNSIIPNEPFTAAGTISAFNIQTAAAGAGPITIKLGTRNSDGTFNYKSTVWTGAIGAVGNNLVTLPAPVAVAAGDYLVYRRTGSTAATLVYATGAASGAAFQITGDLTGASTAAVASTIDLNYNVIWSENISGTGSQDTAIAAQTGVGDNLDFPVALSYGRDSLPGTSNINRSSVYFPAKPIGLAGLVWWLRFNSVTTAGAFEIYVLKPIDAAGTSYKVARIFRVVAPAVAAPVTFLAGTDFDTFPAGKGWRIGYVPVDGMATYRTGGVGYQMALGLSVGDTTTLAGLTTIGIDLAVGIKAPTNVLSLFVEQFGERMRGVTTLLRQLFPGTSTPANWAPGTWTISNGLQSPAVAGWANFARYSVINFLMRRTERAIWRVNNASNTLIFGIGRDTAQGSAVVVDTTDQTLKLYSWLGGATSGTLRATVPLNDVTTGVAFTSPVGSVAGRRYAQEWRRITFRLTCSLIDLTTQERATMDIDWLLTGAAPPTGPKGALCVLFPAGTGAANDVTLERIEAVANTSSSPHVLVLGDSNTEGSALNDLGHDSYAVLLDNARNRGDVMISAKHGGVSADVVASLPALSGITPKYVAVMIGTNDTVQATWRANMASIIASILAMGAQPVLFTLPPQPTGSTQGNLTPLFSADIRADYFGAYPYVDVAMAVSNNHDLTTWAAGMSLADQIHLLPAGHQAVLNQIRADFPALLDGGQSMMPALI